jgi:hypothetical protein
VYEKRDLLGNWEVLAVWRRQIPDIYRAASSGNGDARVNPVEIESCFYKAGWHIDVDFADYLVIGCDNNRLSILAYVEALQTDEPIFELIEHERKVTRGV